MSQPDSAEDDPEVQRNAFLVYGQEFGIPRDVVDTFLDEHFDPSEPFDVNNRRWWRWFRDPAEDVVRECPTCGTEIEDTVAIDEDGNKADSVEAAAGVYVDPCQHVIRVS